MQSEPEGPYVYQPFGSVSNPDHDKAGRLWGIGGLHHFATVRGLTKDEAARVLIALTRGGGWFDIKSAPHSGRDVLLHIPTGQTGGEDGRRTYLTIVGRWNDTMERWDGAGLEGCQPAYWSEIPPAPEHALAPIGLSAR